MKYTAWVIAIGLAIGLVARLTVPGKRPFNVLLALALGAGGAYGAVEAGLHYEFFKPGEVSSLLIFAVAGALILLVLYVAVFRSRS
jgi:uncharacterized membrane protein YeaQ/YmgE (transglycosylase-associated protein family)